jgi:hypothetical protein
MVRPFGVHQDPDNSFFLNNFQSFTGSRRGGKNWSTGRDVTPLVHLLTPPSFTAIMLCHSSAVC